MPDVRWVVSADVASVDTPERVAMIRADRPDQPPVILEGSGAAIWMALRAVQGPATAGELADDLGAPAGDVSAFFAQLAELGFVEPA